MRSYLLLTIFLPTVFACGGTTGNNDPGDLVGTWRQIPSTFDGDVPIEMRATLTLGTDGSYVLVEHSHGDSTETATFSADDTNLTLTGTDNGQPVTLVQPYVVTPDRLMIGAMVPDGAVDGVVGTWHATMKNNAETDTVTFDFHADSTVHYDHQASTKSETFDGTWAPEQDDIVTTFMVSTSTTVHLHIQQIPGLALGGPLFERL